MWWIDAPSSVNTAFWGENMALSALNRGVLAAVIDGACREVEELRKLRFPVVSKGWVPMRQSILERRQGRHRDYEAGRLAHHRPGGQPGGALLVRSAQSPGGSARRGQASRIRATAHSDPHDGP